MDDWTDHESHYRKHFQSDRTSSRLDSYDDARIGYGVGHIAGRNPSYRSRPFEEIEPEIRDNWRDEQHDYDTMRPYIREAYGRTSRR